jgi:hypothetical protein
LWSCTGAGARHRGWRGIASCTGGHTGRRAGFTDGCIRGDPKRCRSIAVSAPTREHNLVAALSPAAIRNSARGWEKCVIKHRVKIGRKYEDVNLSVASSITIGSVRELSELRNFLLFIADGHTVLLKVGRNKTHLLHIPRLVYGESHGTSRARNDVHRYNIVIRARLTGNESELAVLTVVATTRSRRWSSRRHKTRSAGRSSGRQGGRSTGRSSGR